MVNILHLGIPKMEVAWKIHDLPEQRKFSDIVVRVSHILIKMHKMYPDIIMIDMDIIPQIFVKNNVKNPIDMKKFDSNHANWTTKNPFPINSSPELVDFVPFWTDSVRVKSVSWEVFSEMPRRGITVVCYDSTTVVCYVLIPGRENILTTDITKL